MYRNQALRAIFITIFLATAGGATAQPIPGDPAAHMGRVLTFPSMSNVLIEMASFRLHAGGSTAMAWDVVREILRGYDASLPNETVERHVSAALRQYSTPHHSDRVYLANVAHLIWLEWHLHGAGEDPIVGEESEPSFNAMPPISLPRAHLGWSLRDYSTALVDGHLLGALWQDPNNQKAPDNSAARQFHYNFKHFKNAKSALERMVSFHADVQWDHTSAVARLIEWTGDRFAHTYTGWGSEQYTGFGSGDVADAPDLSELYQRRLGGCGMSSAVIALLARSLNIPAAQDRPIINDGPTGRSPESHDYAYFPTLVDPWVHGDAVLRPGGMGLLADDMFVSHATLAKGTFASLWDLALIRSNAAKSALNKARGIYFPVSWNFRRSESHARSFYADSGFVSPTHDAHYLAARYGNWQPNLVPLPAFYNGTKELHIPTQKLELLDEVAAHWPLDGGGAAGMRDALLPRSDGRDVAGSLTASATSVRDGAMHFDGSSHVEIKDRSVLRRNDEELSISIWIRPAAERRGGRILTREISGMPAERDARATAEAEAEVWADLLPEEEDLSLDHQPTPFQFSYKLELTGDGYVRFDYQLKRDGTLVTLFSPSAVSWNEWTHVVVTYDESDHARIWIDGALAAEAPAGGTLPMAHTARGPGGALHYHAYPSRTTIGDGFRGDLDEAILYFGELEQAEVEALHQSYQP